VTTAVKPLPPHGTYARANGCPGYREPCKCQPCLDTRRAAKKRERVNRQLGRPAHRDAAQARARLLELNKVMGWEDIAAAVDSSGSHLREIASGRLLRIKHTTHAKIMAVRPEPTGGQFIDATGSIRRVRALHAIGHTALVIADAAQTHRSRILPLLDGYPRLRRSLAIRIESAYSQLAERPGDNARARNRSQRERWAPPICWNDDTIDDPNAHPDWTGHCGTDRGWWLHSLEEIPVCQPCETAHEQWKAERAHLTGKQRWAELARARGAARTREADLAADARELMRYGASHEQAADRLGVSTSHLHQALKRHPQTERTAA
jgi:hypothetical protein